MGETRFGGHLQPISLGENLARLVAGRWRGVATFGAAVAVAVGYFLVAQLSLRLLTKPEGVALFWPASGLAVGALFALSRRARPMLAIGIAAAVIAANYLAGRSLATSILFSVFNAAEPVLAVWLLERWYGEEFKFNELRRVLGFLAVTCAAAAMSAIGFGAILTFVHGGVPLSESWRASFYAHGLGILVIAPFLIELVQLRRAQASPRRGDRRHNCTSNSRLGGCLRPHAVVGVVDHANSNYWILALAAVAGGPLPANVCGCRCFRRFGCAHLHDHLGGRSLWRCRPAASRSCARRASRHAGCDDIHSHSCCIVCREAGSS